MELGVLAVPTNDRQENRPLDTAMTAGWGHGRTVVMPGQGKLNERAYTAEEREAIVGGPAALGIAPAELVRLFGETTCDVWLNGRAYWANIPGNVWRYKLGGYQVIKKWLSYREKKCSGVRCASMRCSTSAK